MRDEETIARHEYVQHSGHSWRVTTAARVHRGRDWAAYVCASLDSTDPQYSDRMVAGGEAVAAGALTEEQAAELCLSNGNKLDEGVARAMFPGVNEGYRE